MVIWLIWLTSAVNEEISCESGDHEKEHLVIDNSVEVVI